MALSSFSSNFPIPIEKIVVDPFKRFAASMVRPGADERPIEFKR